VPVTAQIQANDNNTADSPLVRHRSKPAPFGLGSPDNELANVRVRTFRREEKYSADSDGLGSPWNSVMFARLDGRQAFIPTAPGRNCGRGDEPMQLPTNFKGNSRPGQSGRILDVPNKAICGFERR
jgi:hypothetical protein